MREIKFRAFDKETKELSHDFLSKNWLKVCIESPYVVLMQYTGLKDRNDKEIYEGDILEHKTYIYPKERRKGIVCYDIEQATYKVVPPSTYQTNAGNGGWTGYMFDRSIATDSRVMGDIHTNPELLEG